MKRFILILTAALLAATTAHGGWWRTFGGEGYDVGNCVQITSDGNYIISGKRDDSLWLLKVDTLGKILWEHTYGESRGMISRWIEETSDGGYIIAPRTPSLLKVDAQGDTQWTADYGMFSYCVQECSDDGYIVVGGDNGYEADGKLILVKTNSEGDTLWTKTYGEPTRNQNSGFFVRQTSDGGYIITGLTGVDTEEFAAEYLWLLKTDADGDAVWTQEYGTGGIGEFNKGYCVRQTSDGGYIITGCKDFPPRGLWLLKTDTDGDTLWTKTYATSLGGTGYNVNNTEDGGYIVVGTNYSLTVYLNAELLDLWLLKTDEVGDTVWTRMYGGDIGNEVGHCVQQTNDSGYIITGYTESFGAGRADIYLLKTDSLGLLAISEEPVAELSPNWEAVTSIGPPIILRYATEPNGFHASVFDISGRKVDEIHSFHSSGILTWGEDHTSGVYFIKKQSSNQTTTAKVVLIN